MKYSINSKSSIILILFCVTFVDVLDFMVVMPLGPDLSKHFGISRSILGLNVAAYTTAAAFSGIISSFFLDKFNRRKALLLSFLGLICSTIYTAFASNFYILLVSRFCAGLFGGPTTALSLAIITDNFEEKNRGNAIGKVMSAFSFAAVIGVPTSLELAQVISWKAPFIGTFTLGAIIWCVLYKALPDTQNQLNEQPKKENYFLIKKVFTNSSNMLLGIIFTSLSMMAMFMVIPYVSAFLQDNIKLPRTYIPHIYLTGGTISFFAIRLAGKLTDRTSSYTTFIFGIVIMSITLIAGLILKAFGSSNLILIFTLFVPFMVGVSVRNISCSTLVTKLPAKHQIAGYMAMISCSGHIFSALGALISSHIIYTNNLNELMNVDIIAFISLILLISSLAIMYVCEIRTKKS